MPRGLVTALGLWPVRSGIILERAIPHHHAEEATDQDARDGRSCWPLLLPATAASADDHVIAPPDSLKWSAGPPALPPGAQIAIVSGDPGKEGLYVLRLKLPAGR